MPHPLPDTLEAWLAGWRASRSGNPYLRLANGDTFVVWPQTTPAGFRARIGRTVVDGRWPDVETTKVALFDLVKSMSPAELAALHGPRDDRQPDRQPDREPREHAGTPPVDDGEILDALPRSEGREALRITLKEYEGHPYIAVRVWVRDDRSGAMWPTRKGCSIRVREIGRVVEALQRAAALATARQAAAGQTAGRSADGPRGGWTERLGPQPSARPGFDEFEGQGG